MTTSAELLSAPQVAALLGISEQAVTQAIRQGRLPALRIGGRWAVRREDAEQWQPKVKEIIR